MNWKERRKMKQLNKWQSIVFLVGGALMVIGAGCFALMFHQEIACWVFTVGALMFVAMQAEQRYDGSDITIRRLRRILLFACFLFLLSAALMVDTVHHFMLPWFDNVETYIQYAYNKWVITLLAAAIVEVYATHRLSHEFAKLKANHNNIHE